MLCDMRKKANSVLAGTDDPNAPSWKQATGDELLQWINQGIGATEAGRSVTARAELGVRQTIAIEAFAAESRRTGNALFVLTLVIVALSGVLVWLTTRL
jgi:hypothetical protein